MNFPFVIKTIFVSFFIFVIIYALSISSTSQDMVASNNYGVKDTVKESLNIGDLRVYDKVTFSDDVLLNSSIENYLKNNNLSIDDVKFDVAVNENIVTIKISTSKNLLGKVSASNYTFSYIVREE